MKKIPTLLLCFATITLVAQSNESSKSITNYASLSFYSQLENPLPKEYVYIDHFDQFIDIPNEPSLRTFGEADIMNSSFSGEQWFGTSSTNKFQFMNREFESTQIYDLNGVLRQTSVSFSFRKKK
ncbi:MAG: hypothetical protein AAF843_08185 [Bacteroidota bacterium]